MSWEEDDPYNQPESFGLEIVFSDDQGGAYQFDMFVVWESEDGTLYYATDSGCSCPSPFNRITEVDQLEKVSPEEAVDRYHDWLGWNERSGDSQTLRSALRGDE